MTYSILIVEDEFIVSAEIEERLTSMGYSVSGRADTGEKALELVNRQHPDLILMDIRLKGEMDGIAAAGEIRQRFHIPVIFLTAYSEDATLERAKLTEPYGYILKPFDDRELKSAIEIALYRHSAEAEIRRLNRLYDVLSQVNQAVVRIAFRDELLQAVCRLIVERGSVDLAWIDWFDPETARTNMVVCFGERKEILREKSGSSNDGSEEQNKQTGHLKTVFVSNDCNPRNCPYSADCAGSRLGFRSCASFPIHLEGKVCGMLRLGSMTPGFFREKEVELLTEVAMDISFGLEKMETEARRERAEFELRQSEEKLRLFIEHAPVALAMFDRQMRYLNVSRRWRDDFHLGDRNLRGLSHYEVFPEIPEYWKEIHRRCLAGEILREEGDRFERIDGSVQWLRWEVRPWRGMAGDVEGILIFSEDITERKQTQETVAEREHYLRTILQTTVDGFWVVGRDGRLIEVNEAYCQMSGYSYDELLEMCISDIEAVEEPADTAARIERVVANGSEIFETRHRRKDGEVFDVQMSVTYLAVGQGQFICFCRDITERKRHDEALRHSEERYRLLVDTANEGICEIDAEHRFTYVNEAMACMLGYTSLEVLGKKYEEFILPEDMPFHKIEMDKRHAGIDDVYERRFKKHDGSILWALVSAKAKTDDNGLFSGSFAMLTNITERKRMEEEKSRIEAQLRQTQKMEAIGHLAGGIAHDFNNILSAIIGYTELALDGVPESGTLGDDLKEVLSAGMRAKELVNQILTFSRQSAREPKPVEITYIVKEVVKMLRAMLPAMLPAMIDIRLRSTLPSESRVLADPTEIHQVVMNLCTNAAHAMRAKGGNLDIELKEIDLGNDTTLPHPDLTSGRYLQLRIADTGHGMSEEIVAQIFDPFFTTKPQGEGTGMGLSVLHGIVKSCKGAITVDSKEGGGSTFCVYLPAITMNGTETAQDTPKFSGGKGRILFVDDEKPLAELGQKMLSRMGYSVTIANSSREAIEMIASNPFWFDILVTDFTMPRMTGLDLAEEVNRIRPGMPVIVCSGHNDTVDEKTATTFGIEAFVKKPFDWQELASTIQNVLTALRNGG